MDGRPWQQKAFWPHLSTGEGMEGATTWQLNITSECHLPIEAEERGASRKKGKDGTGKN